MATYEQLPARGYPGRAFPLRMLAHGGVAAIALGLSFPDGEQRPERGYPLGAHPLRHLARVQSVTPIPPIPPTPTSGAGRGKRKQPLSERLPLQDLDRDDREMLELIAMIAPIL